MLVDVETTSEKCQGHGGLEKYMAPSSLLLEDHVWGTGDEHKADSVTQENPADVRRWWERNPNAWGKY